MSGFRWKEEFSPWKNGKFVGGIDQESVSGSITGPHVGSAVGTPFAFGTTGSADVPTFRVSSAFAGLSHNFQLSKAWVMQPSVGVRTYNSNIYGSKATPNAGVSFISDNTTFYANYTEGLLYPGAETYTLTRAIPMAFAANNGWDRLSPSQNKHSEVGVKWDASAQTHIDLSVSKTKSAIVMFGLAFMVVLSPIPHPEHGATVFPPIVSVAPRPRSSISSTANGPCLAASRPWTPA